MATIHHTAHQDPTDRALRRVLTVYNTDYDEELRAASDADVSAVREAAAAVSEATRRGGYQAELVGVHGADLGDLWARLRRDPPDLVFNLCESLAGDTGNEPLVPGLLDLLRIPYTGPGPLALGMCLHKDRTKEVLVAQGVPTPAHRVLRTPADLEGPAAAALEELAYPFFVKLAREDASIGIAAENVVANPAALKRRAAELFERHRQAIIAERFVEGREVNVTVMGNEGELSCLPLHEIDFAQMPPDRPHIISYAAKWDESHPDYAGTLPVPLRDPTPGLVEQLEHTAKRAFLALGLRDFGRVDLRVDTAGQPWVIDVNPNCDLSPDAGVARAAAVAGLDFTALIGRLCEIAWKRHVHHHSPASPH